MFDFLDDVRDFFTPARESAGESAGEPAAPTANSGAGWEEPDTMALPAGERDYSGLAAYAEEPVNITAIEAEGRYGEDVDALLADHAVSGFRSLPEMAAAVAEEANGAPLGRLEIVDHARPGLQEIGDQDLSLESLENEDVAAALAQLRDQFGDEGELVLKGCRVGGDAEGDALLRALANQVNVPVSGSSEYQTPYLPGLEGPVKTCYPSEYDEETQKWWQTCTTTSNPVDKAYDALQDWIGGGILEMEQSDMD